jgi:hypothetical protein
LSISLTEVHPLAKVMVADLSGRIIFSASYENIRNLKLDFTSFNTGVYQVTVVTPTERYMRKVVK